MRVLSGANDFDILCNFPTLGIWRWGGWTIGSWDHISFDYDSSSVDNDPVTYMNGAVEIPVETLTPIGTIDSGADSAKIGSGPNNSQEFNGQLAHFAVWSVELSAEEHLAMAHGVLPFAIRHDNLEIYWPVWGNQDPEPDWSSTQAVGTINNDPARSTPNPATELLENYL